MAKTNATETALAEEKLLLTPRQAAKSMTRFLDLNLPVMLWGAPGIGKSDVVKQVAALRGWPTIDLRAALLDPVDLRGVPYVVDGECRQAVPDILPREDRDGPEGVLFLDELPQAPPATQGALLQLVLDRRIERYRMPAGWRIVAAGNERQHMAGGFKLISALSRRLVNLDLIPDHQEWRLWASAHGVPPVLIAFISYRPSLLASDDLRQRVGPNPRAWAMAGRMIEQGLDPETELHDIAGVVGKGPASELLAFLEVWRNLPDPDGVIKNPRKAAVPTDTATLYAICGALSSRADVDNVAAIFEYGDRLPPEYTTLLATDCVRMKPLLGQTPAWLDYVRKNGDAFLGR